MLKLTTQRGGYQDSYRQARNANGSRTPLLDTDSQPFCFFLQPPANYNFFKPTASPSLKWKHSKI